MSAPTIRLAKLADVDQLVALRSDFTFEDVERRVPRVGYEAECRTFLVDAISSGRWQIWVAELEGQVVSHAFVALVDKVPRPIRDHTRIAYLTNVYTRPDFRGGGIGAAVVAMAQDAAREADVELMLVWPSDESADFYEREGFESADGPLIWRPRA